MKTSIFPPALALFGFYPALTEVRESSAVDFSGARWDVLPAAGVPLKPAQLWKCRADGKVPWRRQSSLPSGLEGSPSRPQNKVTVGRERKKRGFKTKVSMPFFFFFLFLPF